MEGIKAEKATLYLAGGLGFGFQKIEVKTVEVEIKPYAQYAQAVHVRFVPKGKRAVRGTVQSYKPSLIVVEGWGHAEPGNWLVDTAPGCKRSKYASCDPRWESEFADDFAAYVARSGAKVLADYRSKGGA